MYDAIVIGTGGVGSATLLQLAARGLRVLGLDRFPPGHARGSSHGESRIIRQAYFEHPAYVPLLRRAYELWHELETDVRRTLFHRVGLVEVGPADGIVVPGVLQSAREHQLAVDSLDASELSKRFPFLLAPEEMVGVFEADAGYLLVEDCVVAHATQAAARGATLHIGETVRGWRADGNGVSVETDQATYRATRLVITAGAWASDLLADLKIPLRVVRKHLHWFRTKTDEGAMRGAPTYLLELPDGVFYGFPEVSAGEVKVAEHTGGQTVADPLTDPADVEPTDLARVQQFVQSCLPGVTTEPMRHARCFYTMSPDENFIVDRHPDHPQVVFAAGLSGHGFKFTPVLGEILAQLAVDGSSPHPSDFLGMRRLA